MFYDPDRLVSKTNRLGKNIDMVAKEQGKETNKGGSDYDQLTGKPVGYVESGATYDPRESEITGSTDRQTYKKVSEFIQIEGLIGSRLDVYLRGELAISEIIGVDDIQNFTTMLPEGTYSGDSFLMLHGKGHALSIDAPYVNEDIGFNFPEAGVWLEYSDDSNYYALVIPTHYEVDEKYQDYFNQFRRVDDSYSVSQIDESFTNMQQDINNAVQGVLKFRGNVATVSSLPTQSWQRQTGYVYHVNADNSEWFWNGSAWEELGKAGTVLPAVSAADNGKFVRVANGAYVVETVPSAESEAY